MQLIVLGMHRSGTSMVTRLLNLMGAYFGPEGISLGANEENPKGFWERRDVLDLDEALLLAAGADWFRVAHFSLEKIPKEALMTFRDQASKLLLELDAHRPWVMKEPRQCLLLPLWRQLLEVPVCIYVHRQPIQIAQSLHRRNDFPISFGLALWERYTLDALRAMAGLPVIRVMHEDLMRDPVEMTASLFTQLEALGVRGLRHPSEREILAFIEPKLFRQTGGEDLQNNFINIRQRALNNRIKRDFERLLVHPEKLHISAAGQAQLFAYPEYTDVKKSLAEVTANHEVLSEQHSLQQASLQTTEQALRERATQLEQRELDLAALSTRLQGAEQALADSATQLEQRELDLAALSTRLQGAEQALADSATQLEQRDQQCRTQADLMTAAEQARTDLSNQVVEVKAREAQLAEHLDHYHAVIHQAALDLEAIRVSARWQTGHRLMRTLEILLLRGRPRLVIDELADRLKQTRLWGEALTTATQPDAKTENSDIASLREWMGLLDADYRNFLHSVRWRVGHSLVRTIEIGIGRGKPLLATDQLREVLGQATDWASSGDEDQDIRQFEIWFAQIDRALRDLLASKRWLIGNSLIGALDRLLWRGRRRLAVDHMREVLGYYGAWRNHRHPIEDDDNALARLDALALAPEPTSPFHHQVDVIVPVFNALEDVKHCLASVLSQDDGSLARLILINDGSAQDTRDWLNEFSQTHEQVHLLEHPVNQGYTQAVNTGLRASTAPIILILNSDTIVTRGWLNGLLRCLASDPRIGIVGPLSNAATWQNVPDLYDANHHFANNVLPAGMSPNDMALVVAHASARAYPATPFVNGFCFMLKREVMDAIGIMDQVHFPTGYGEENDYCIRAAQAGYQLRIADDVYVYHAQSKSFGHERRETLSADGFQALERKHGVSFFHAQVSRVKDTRALDRVRERIRQSLETHRQWEGRRAQPSQGVIDSASYLPRHHPLPAVPSENITVHIIIYSDHPGPDLRLTLDALAPGNLARSRFLHLAADWAPVEQRFQHQALFAGQVHHFSDERGFYAAVKSVMDDIGSAHFCVIRQGAIVLPSVINALLEACVSPSGYAAASPVTNRLTGLAIPLSPGGTPLSTNAKLALTHGECLSVVTPMLDLDVFMLSKQALERLPFPGFVNDKTDQSLVRFFVALTQIGLSLGILLSRYAFLVSNGPFAPPRPIDAITSLAQPEDREDLRRRMTAFKQIMSPWKMALQHSQPLLTAGETVCVLMSTLHLFGGVIVLVNWINQLILTGVAVRVYVLHYDGAPAHGLRLLFDPKPLTDTAAMAAELPRAVRIIATLWSTVAIAEELVSRVPAARGYYFIQDYETLFYRNNPAEHGQRRAAEATYGTPLRKVVTSRWIADQLPAAAKQGPDPIERIPVGIDHSIFPPTEPCEITTDSPPVILAMARPETPRRGFALLIAALTLIKARHPRVRVHLFGTTALSQHHIPFTYVDFGIVHSGQLRQVYAEADIFVDSSDFQGFGLCPLEAMALGCGCVLTDSGGILEYAAHEVNALIVPHQAGALAEAIGALIDDPALRHRLGAAGVQTARAFDCSRTTREWLQLFGQDRAHQAPAKAPGSVVVIPIFNQMQVARPCIDSVLKHLPDGHAVLLVDDGSDADTAKALADYADHHHEICYLRNAENLGFVQTANRGMAWAADQGQDIILLNSDTLVVAGWIERLEAAAYSSPQIGVVSPLATASPHLSLAIAPGESFISADQWLRHNVKPSYPTIITPEGWCFFIKWEVYQRLGGFDPIFGRGYCEESDYCMRAIAAGFRLAACENLLIHHQGRVTFGAEQGTRYSENRKIFDTRWLPIYRRLYQEFLRLDPLHQVRSAYRQANWAATTNRFTASGLDIAELLADPKTERDLLVYEGRQEAPRPLPERPSLLFLIPRFTTPTCDPALVVLINSLLLAGLSVKLVAFGPGDWERPADLLTAPLFLSWRQALQDGLPQADLVVATDWTTLYLGARLAARWPEYRLGHFIQEFEPDLPEVIAHGWRDQVLRAYRWPILAFAETEAIRAAVPLVGGGATRMFE